VCPVVSKIFENCLLTILNVIKTSDRQFGFKKGVGCVDSIHNVRKVINYFNSRNSTVSIGAIDLKSAFDKINVFGLLNILHKRQINVRIINVLENWFTKCYMCTRWGECRSEYLPLSSGVRQGGILSPLLFNLFVDSVLSEL